MLIGSALQLVAGLTRGILTRKKTKTTSNPWWRRTEPYQRAAEIQHKLEKRELKIKKDQIREDLRNKVKHEKAREKRYNITLESLFDCNQILNKNKRISKRKGIEMLKESIKECFETGFYDKHPTLTSVIANNKGTYHIESLKKLGLWDGEIEKYWQENIVNPRRNDETQVESNLLELKDQNFRYN